VADGVGGWAGTFDPSMFSQAIMYHAHRLSAEAWAGEPEVDPTLPDEVEDVGPTLTPTECMQKAYDLVLKEPGVPGGNVNLPASRRHKPSTECSIGSSTACILNMCSLTGTLNAAK
jgi:hypothetical protein